MKLQTLKLSKVMPLEPAAHAKPIAATARITGRRLQRIRAEQMRTQPLCVRCDERGIARVFDVIDHIVPLALGGADVADNRRPVCTPCHLVITAEQFGRLPA
jgi:5-methylcytosine-specific restriction protein A